MNSIKLSINRIMANFVVSATGKASLHQVGPRQGTAEAIYQFMQDHINIFLKPTSLSKHACIASGSCAQFLVNPRLRNIVGSVKELVALDADPDQDEIVLVFAFNQPPTVIDELRFLLGRSKRVVAIKMYEDKPDDFDQTLELWASDVARKYQDNQEYLQTTVLEQMRTQLAVATAAGIPTLLPSPENCKDLYEAFDNAPGLPKQIEAVRLIEVPRKDECSHSFNRWKGRARQALNHAMLMQFKPRRFGEMKAGYFGIALCKRLDLFLDLSDLINVLGLVSRSFNRRFSANRALASILKTRFDEGVLCKMFATLEAKKVPLWGEVKMDIPDGFDGVFPREMLAMVRDVSQFMSQFILESWSHRYELGTATYLDTISTLMTPDENGHPRKLFSAAENFSSQSASVQLQSPNGKVIESKGILDGVASRFIISLCPSVYGPQILLCIPQYNGGNWEWCYEIYAVIVRHQGSTWMVPTPETAGLFSDLGVQVDLELSHLLTYGKGSLRLSNWINCARCVGTLLRGVDDLRDGICQECKTKDVNWIALKGLAKHMMVDEKKSRRKVVMVRDQKRRKLATAATMSSSSASSSSSSS